MRVGNSWTPGRRLAVLLWVAGVDLGGRRIIKKAPTETPVRILAPAPHTLLLSPEVEVLVRLTPPLGIRERLEVSLFEGVDALDTQPIRVRDLSDAAVLSPDASALRVRIDALPPGRSTVEVLRSHDDGQTPDFSTSRVLDRGGFANEGNLLGAGVMRASMVRASTIDPASERTLDLLAWYPTDADEPPDPRLRAVALPALVYSHGNCGSADAFTTLASALARAGFVVASISHTGDTSSDPGCGETRNQAISFFERPNDVVATLDWLVELPAAGSGGRLVDPTRMGLAGHSFGGQTTLRTARLEPRLRAALALAPPSQATLGSLPLPIPTMVQGASLDTTTPFIQQQQLFDRLTTPRLLVEILGEGHSAFTDAAPARTRALVILGTYLAGDARWDALLEAADGAILDVDGPLLPRREACRNGLDDDGDGRVDAGSDPGCTTPDGETELPRDDLRIELPGALGGGRGILPLRLLGHEGLELNELDPATLRFGPGRASLAHHKGPHAGHDERQRTVRVAHFRAIDADLSPSDTQACLQGEIAGEPFVACTALKPKGGPRSRSR
jgi:predicted dienelactone hydrolase